MFLCSNTGGVRGPAPRHDISQEALITDCVGELLSGARGQRGNHDTRMRMNWHLPADDPRVAQAVWRAAPGDFRRLRQREAENARPKKLVAKRDLETETMKQVESINLST